MFTLFITLVLSCRPALIPLPLTQTRFYLMTPPSPQGCTIIKKCDTALNGVKPLSYTVQAECVTRQYCGAADTPWPASPVNRMFTSPWFTCVFIGCFQNIVLGVVFFRLIEIKDKIIAVRSLVLAPACSPAIASSRAKLNHTAIRHAQINLRGWR